MSSDFKTIVTQATKTNVDNVTGEVISSEEFSTTRIPQTPDFVMTFTQDIGFIANISGGASKLLFGILSEISRSNTVVLIKEVKEKIAKKVGLNPNSIDPLISSLVKNKVLLRENNKKRTSIYLINPHFFGKGKWVNINKLRMLVEYDFVHGKKSFGIETEYIDEKDDYIGQLIEHQDEVLDKIEKIKNSKKNNIIEAKIDEPLIPKIKPNNEIKDFQDLKQFDIQLENENLKLKLANIEAEKEKLKLEIELMRIKQTI